MNHDHTTRNDHPTGSEPPRNARDARGRWMKGHCPNPKGRPKKKRFKDYNPSDVRHFVSTQIEVATADGPQLMDRRTALLNKMFEGAMKGKATPLRMMMAMIKENDQQMAELRLQYERLERELIHDNPGFEGIDESLTHQQKIDLFGLATVLNHYYPGEYDTILGKAEGSIEGWSEEEILEKLRAAGINEQGRKPKH